MNVSAADCLPDVDLDARVETCTALIKAAGALAAKAFDERPAGAFEMKGPQDFLTETDLAVEKLIRSVIESQFPDDGFLGEETGGVVEGNYWVVDPIDGTANFARGIPHYCVAMAFVSAGAVQFGAIYNPSFDELYFARLGQGAYRNDAKISVSRIARADEASIEVGWSNRLPNQQYFDIIHQLFDNGANVRRASSGALGLAYVAEGRSDGYAELHMNAWDCLAGFLLVQEAGGVIGGFPETEELYQGGKVLAATPGVADLLAKASGIPVIR